MADRRATIERETGETSVSVTLGLDRPGEPDIDTGIGFLDHLLTSLAVHGGLDLRLSCEGDRHVDDHHTAEDCAISLGKAIDSALDDRRGIERFGYAYAPLDEALARAVVDLSGRPHAEVDLGLDSGRLGELAKENVAHVIHSLSINADATVHVDVLRGENDHHRAEAAMKALALALRTAVSERDDGRIPSTKGTLH